MTLHARPHLSTHGRSNGHSAVAGVAYRLGLRLYDERAQKWHDFRARRLGDHIAAALTIAPEGAPDWATDPQVFWNAVEAAEKRKDSQLARDYRVPIPLGVGVDEAKQMAIDMARQIMEKLHTPVSIGLHRDSDKTVLGTSKPEVKRGYHAHLYFPTRALEEIGQADGGSAWGLGTKFAFLTSRHLSSGFVESLNAGWAELANHYAQAADRPADYDHRSYLRMGLEVEPQRTLGAAATAMERRGFWTRKGEDLRGHIVVESEVLRTSLAETLQEQHAQALVDVNREVSLQVETVIEEDDTASPEVPLVSVQPAPSAPPTPPPPAALPEGAVGSLLWRFRQAVPVPDDPDALGVYAHVVRLIRTIERLLSALAHLVDRKEEQDEDRGRRIAARLETEYQASQARRRRSVAQKRLEDWELEHPWRMAVAKAAGNKPAEWEALHDVVEQENTYVQKAKATREGHMQQMELIEREDVLLVAQEGTQTHELARAIDVVQQLSPALLDQLLSVSDQGERLWLEAAKPVVAEKPTMPAADVSAPIEGQQLALRPRPPFRMN